VLVKRCTANLSTLYKINTKAPLTIVVIGAVLFKGSKKLGKPKLSLNCEKKGKRINL